MLKRPWQAIALLFVAAALMLALAVAFAQEQRCVELGPACVCAEAFDTATYTRHASGSFWNPSDSNAKECSQLNSEPGWAVARNANDVQGRQDAEALAALPPGATARWFLGAADNHVGLLLAGLETMPDAAPRARAAMRWYVFHSANYAFDTGGCVNSKLAGFTGTESASVNVVLDNTRESVSVYNLLALRGPDCCGHGRLSAGHIDASFWRGKWVALEAIFTPREKDQPFRLEVYARDITGGGTEVKVVDTDLLGVPLAYIERPRRFLASSYRQPAVGGQCVGYRLVSHLMVAAWPTDTGQRIGAATEMEPTTVSPPAPPAPVPPPAPAPPPVPAAIDCQCMSTQYSCSCSCA